MPHVSFKSGFQMCYKLWLLHGHKPLLIVSAGDHCDRSISRQILPLLLMFGW